MNVFQNAFQQNFDMEDELYMQRRHDVAMEGIEEEWVDGHIIQEGANPFYNGDDYIPLDPIENENENNMNEEEWEELPGFLERQPAIPMEEDLEEGEIPPLIDEEEEELRGVGPFEAEEEEEDIRRREEWLRNNYEIAIDPNSDWEQINNNQRWRENPDLVRFVWQFPSQHMKDIDKKSTVLEYLFQQHRENQRLLQQDNRLPVHFKNQFLGVHLSCNSCNCCDRHMKNRPGFREDVPFPPFDHQFKFLERGEKENRCICPCRHIMRANNRLIMNMN